MVLKTFDLNYFIMEIYYKNIKLFMRKDTSIVCTEIELNTLFYSVSDPLHFDADPDPLPRIRIRIRPTSFFFCQGIKLIMMFFFVILSN